MSRRTFIGGLTLGALAAPIASESQPTPMRLAMLLTGPQADATPEYAAFMKQLGNLGWIEGQTLVIDRRSADVADKFIVLAADAVREKPAVFPRPGLPRRGLRSKQPRPVPSS